MAQFVLSDEHIIFGLQATAAEARQPWTNSRDCSFEYLIIYSDYLIIPFNYFIVGQDTENSYLQWKRDFYS